MNYKIIHDNIIKKAKNRVLDGYYEEHHILPKSMGGNDNSDNLVKLTAKEHFIIHKLLVEIYPNEDALVRALWMMMNARGAETNVRTYRVGAREYERTKILHRIADGIECYLLDIYSDEYIRFDSRHSRHQWLEIEGIINSGGGWHNDREKQVVGGKYIFSDDLLSKDEKYEILSNLRWSNKKIYKMSFNLETILEEFDSCRDAMRAYNDNGSISSSASLKHTSIFAQNHRWVYAFDLYYLGKEKINEIKKVNLSRYTPTHIVKGIMNIRFTEAQIKYPFISNGKISNIRKDPKKYLEIAKIYGI